MNLDILRASFPNCGVCVSPNGITLILPRYDTSVWVSENIGCDPPLDNKPVFDAMANIATHATIVCGMDQMTRITFHADLPAKHAVVYPPVKRPRSGVESDNQFYARLERDGLLDGNLQFYSQLAEELDMGNPDDVREALRRILNRAPKDPKAFDVNGLRNWDRLLSAVRGFIKLGSFTDYQIEPPDAGLDFGTASFYIETTGNEKRIIAAKQYEAFRAMLEEADTVEISSRYQPGNTLFALTVYS